MTPALIVVNRNDRFVFCIGGGKLCNHSMKFDNIPEHKHSATEQKWRKHISVQHNYSALDNALWLVKNIHMTCNQCDHICQNFATEAKFEIIFGHFLSLFSIWQNGETTLANKWYFWEKVHCSKWPNIEKII